jgi:two-component system, OmpR family, sensor kinase
MYIRTRLALWFILMLAIGLIAFSFVIYQLTRNNLLEEIGKSVAQRAKALEVSVRPLAGESNLRLPELDVFAAPDVFVQIVSADGAVLASSANLGKVQLPLLKEVIAEGRVEEVRINNRPLFMFGKAVILDGQTVGYVLVARTPQTIYFALNRLSQFLYPAVPITLLLGGLITWLLVRRSLRPLSRLAVTAAEIAQDKDHTRRLVVSGSKDEIKNLAVTINRMLQSLEEAYRQVQETNETQRQFLADVSHELRTPLTIMLSSLDIIGRVGTTDPDFQAHTLADMRIEVDRMARLVTQLLILARTEAGVEVLKQPILIEDVIEEVCRQSQPPLSGAVTLVGCNGKELEGAVICGNFDYLKQLFLILLDNAFKYTKQGKVGMTAAVKQTEVVIEVWDSGIGIAAKDLERIFERFYRAENAQHRSGVGLGLAIARSIVELHEGKIVAESESGQGSRFTVHLPLLNQIESEIPANPELASSI